jgi:WD40-like Beta Propeller Repeat
MWERRPAPTGVILPAVTRLLSRAAALLIALSASSAADAQVYVTPRRPGKTVVRVHEQSWQTIDLLVDAEIDGEKAAGVRLFFYDEERDAAEQAAVLIEQAYRELCVEMGHVPQKRFNYVLYSTYQEFLRTSLFPMQEGVLGVTSTRSLEVTLPWFGDVRDYAHVNKHELVHQFTIQMARSMVKGKDSRLDPIQAYPLWFIEGLAEYISQGGLDAEGEMQLRDLVVNPDLYSYFVLSDFFDDSPSNVLMTYKLGQARIAFLEEVYGEGTAVGMLEDAARMVTVVPEEKRGKLMSFTELLSEKTGDSRFEISAKFDAWIKRMAFPVWLEAEQDPAAVRPINDLHGYVGAIDSSPDGSLLLYRSIEASTGRSRLYLVDPRDAEHAERVALDGGPGVESLHPVDARNFDLGAKSLVWVAESRGFDMIYWQAYSHEAAQGDERSKRQQRLLPGKEKWQVKVKFGPRRGFRLSHWGLVAATSPVLSPDGKRVAFVGLSQDGRQDVYVLTPGDNGSDGAANGVPSRVASSGAVVHRLTNDNFAERGLAWDSQGVIVASDRGEGGHFNLYRIDANGGEPTRLTNEPRDHLSPTVLGDGRVAFTAWDGTRSDVYVVDANGTRPLTDVTTGLSQPAAGVGDEVWALLRLSGRSWPVRIGPAEGEAPSGWHAQQVSEPGTREPSPWGVVDEPPVAQVAPAPVVVAPSPWGVDAPAPSNTSVVVAPAVVAGPSPWGEGTPGVSTAPSGGLVAADGGYRAIPRMSLDAATPYQPLDLRSWGLGDIFALVGAGGGAIYGQVFATASDQLKEHSVVLSAALYGSIRLADGYLLFMDESKRVTWGGGPFTSLRFRVDPTFEDEGLTFQSGERYHGGMGLVRLPLDRFLYLQLDQSVGAADYFLYDSTAEGLEDPDTNGLGRDLLPEWEDENDAFRMQTETSARVGLDTIGYHWATGPLTGMSAMLEGTVGWQPAYQERWFGARLDAEKYFALSRNSGANIGLRGSGGKSWGGDLARYFYLSSYHTLRGVSFGDSDFLLGRNFWFTNAELQVPMQSIIAVAFLSTVEGVIGLDFGGVADNPNNLWDNRVMDLAIGANLVLGPFVFKVHFARTLDVGAPLPDSEGSWVPNIWLTWLQL